MDVLRFSQIHFTKYEVFNFTKRLFYKTLTCKLSLEWYLDPHVHFQMHIVNHLLGGQ